MSKSAQKILSTAEQLFNQHSFTGVGVDLIRDESGCSKTTLYTHFKNKQQLVQEVLKARDLRFRQSLMDYAADAQGLDALERIYDWHMQWFQADHFKGCLFVRAVSESSAQEQEIHQIAKAHKLWLRRLIAQCTAELDGAQELSAMFYHQLEGLISRFLVEGYDAKTAAHSKKLLFKMTACFQNSAE